MKIMMIVVRTLVGLLFLFASITFFLMTLFPAAFPMPPMEGTVKTFNEGLFSVGYFFPMLKIVEFLCGLAFLVGRYVPLATVVIAPVIVNIAMFHFCVDRNLPGPAIAAFLVFANIFVAYYYRDAYRPLLRAK